MKLSEKQSKALILASECGGFVNTDMIAGSTGASLERRGLVSRRFVAYGYGLITTYDLTAAGWKAVLELENREVE